MKGQILVDIAALTEKYTGQCLDLDTLLVAHRGGGVARVLAHEIERAATAVSSAEDDLTRIAASITDSASKVSENITAVAGQTVRSINPLGELQAKAPRFDALIAVRDERINHLRALIRLWNAHTDPDGAAS
jgi:hypothetical protein